MEISNKTLAMFLVAAIVVSLGGTILSLQRLNSISTTGYATANTQGNATINVTSQTSLRFAINSVNFGTGSVNTTGGYTNCIMSLNDTAAFTKVGCLSFNANNAAGPSFVIENDGNTYVNLTLNASKNATGFIGGTSPAFEYAIYQNETTSCKLSIYNESNVSTVAANVVNICQNLSYLDTEDTLRIYVRVTIPYDAPLVTSTTTFTAEGTSY